MRALDLSYEGFTVRAVAPADDLAWARDFVACGLEAGLASSSDADPSALAAPPAGARVELVIDPSAHAALLARGPSASDPPLEAFANDSEPMLLRPWSTAAGATVLHDERLALFFRVSGAGRVVSILAREGGRRPRMELVRVVRELVMDHVVAAGGALIHGAVVRSGDRTIVLSGPRESGKTTLLLALLAETEVAYVANDRCALRVDGGQALIRGVPTLVSIRRDRSGAFPRALAPLLDARAELDRAPPRPNLSVSPAELCRALGLRTAHGGRLAAFVFPAVTGGAERLALRRLTAAEALESLRGGLFRAGRPALLGEVFVSAATRGLSPWAVAEPAARWVAENVPCFHGALGGGGPPARADCEALLGAVAS